MPPPDCPYAILGINPDATEDDVVKSHRRLILTHHPDKTDDPTATETAKRLNDAKDRALKMIALHKKKRQMEMELQQHVYMLKTYIMKTAFDSTSLPNELHPKIKAAVADCKGRVGMLASPYPELDAYYLLVGDLIERFKSEIGVYRELYNDANIRITDLQARLNAETTAREHAENGLKRHKALHDTV